MEADPSSCAVVLTAATATAARSCADHHILWGSGREGPVQMSKTQP